MKKFLLLMMSVLIAAMAWSQDADSDKWTWYARLGMSVNNATGGKMVKDLNSQSTGNPYHIGSRIGMSADLGGHYPISDFGLYWGMELGVGTCGFSIKEEYSGEWEKLSIMRWNVKYAPLIIGYKKALSNDIKLDIHVGGFASVDFAGRKLKLSDSYGHKFDEANASDWNLNDADVGIQAGIGVWFKRFNLDCTYERGFIPMAEPEIFFIDNNLNFHSKQYKLYSSSVVIRIGYAF